MLFAAQVSSSAGVINPLIVDDVGVDAGFAGVSPERSCQGGPLVDSRVSLCQEFGGAVLCFGTLAGVSSAAKPPSSVVLSAFAALAPDVVSALEPAVTKAACLPVFFLGGGLGPACGAFGGSGAV